MTNIAMVLCFQNGGSHYDVTSHANPVLTCFLWAPTVALFLWRRTGLTLRPGSGGGGGGGQWTHRGGFQAVGGTYGASRLQADSTHERVVKKEDGERLAKVRLKHINASSTVRYCLTLSLCRVLVLSLCVSGTHQMFNRLFLHGSSPRRI